LAIADLTENQRLRQEPAAHHEDMEVYAERGMAHAGKGDDDSAIADLERGIRHTTNPGNAEPALALAQVLARKQMWEKAIEEYGFVLGCYNSQEYAKQEALALYYRSQAHASNNNPEESRKDHDRALSLDPSLANRPTDESLRAQVEKQLQEKKATEERLKTERDAAIATLAASIPNPHKPEPGDTWSDVAAKARTLRKAGHVEAAVAALNACQIMLGDGNRLGQRYVETALALTPILAGLGVDGGLYVFDTEHKGFFRDKRGDVLTRYNGRLTCDREDLAKALKEAIPGEPVLIECLVRQEDQQHFQKKTSTMPGGRLGATFMPI
jgi:tetratricopeptide (TPR) repeat protein